MQITIIVTMCLINLVLWLVFFLKFKSLFSTEDVIRKTREQISQLMSEVNRTTLENINIIDFKIEELNQAVENAGKKKITRTKNYAEKIVEEEPAFEIKVNKPAETKKSKKEKQDIPNIYVAKKTIEPKKNFQERVIELSKLGYSVEQIAKDTEHSTTEVQFVIDML